MKKRCEFEGCKKKLMLTSITCKCGKTFCNLHRYMEEHNCDFDIKKDCRENKEKRIEDMKCVNNKTEKI